MKVQFSQPWFGPSDVSREGKINQASGRRYRPGVHYVPAEMKPLLPKTAKIIEDDSPPPAVSREPELTLRDFDEVRAEGDAAEEAGKKAEAELRANAEKLKRELEADEKPSKKKPGKE